MSWPKPYPFQRDSVMSIDEFDGRSLLSLDMGLGKTIISLRWLYEDKSVRLPAVVVCPASIKFHWEREAEQRAGLNVLVLEGRSNNGCTKEYLKQFDLVVVNYDILQNWVKLLKQIRPKTVILDECQAIMNSKAIRTKTTKRLCKGVRHLLALSGTPMMNRPIELFNTVNLLRPEVFEHARSFKYEFCGAHWTPWGWKFDRSSNTKRLHRLLLSSCMIRYRKQDVLQELPAKQRHLITLPLTSMEEYEEARDNFIGWLQKLDTEKAQRAMRAESMTRLGYLLRLAARLKLPYVVEWAEQFLDQTGEKLVIFGVHKEVLGQLRQSLKYKSVLIDGSVTGSRRQQLVDQFQQDPKTRLFLGNLRAAGVGLTLTAASTVAFAELSYRPADLLQAEDRVHRIGQVNQVAEYYLVAHGTIEEKLCRVLQKKLEMISSVIDGRPARDFDVLSQVRRLLCSSTRF